MRPPPHRCREFGEEALGAASAHKEVMKQTVTAGESRRGLPASRSASALPVSRTCPPAVLIDLYNL